MKKNKSLPVILILVGLLFAVGVKANDTQIPNREYSINIGPSAVRKGYTVKAFEDKIKLSLIPKLFSESTRVRVMELNEFIPEPWNLDRVSPVYQFDFVNKNAYDNKKPFIIQLNYEAPEGDNNLKQVYYFNRVVNAWVPLPTKDYVGENMVRAYIHLPFARMAVFSNPDAMGVGRASWYGYKGGNFAASPDFPKGSKLRVYNLANDKQVDVVINDYGPDRGIHPDRVIDLDKVAFAELDSLGAGIIDVSIEPLYVAPRPKGSVLGVKIQNSNVEPVSKAKAVVIVDKDSGEQLFARNENDILPLASLTKLVTASVFLDTNPDFSKIVTYKNEDEEKTWDHVKKYESARLRIEDNDTLTVEDLFKSSLMASLNNATETLVRISDLSREEFIRKMNEKVQLWGATETLFIEPTGLAPENVSTVNDYVIIMKEVFKNPKMLAITTSKEYRFETLTANKKFRIRNTNKLLQSNFYVTGGKTGYLDEAGYCLAMKIDTKKGELIGVLFGAETREQSFEELQNLLKYASRKKNNSN